LAIIARASKLTITRPGDLKVLLDAARMAQERADKIEATRTGEMSQQEIAAQGAKILHGIDLARRRDFACMARIAAEAACKEAGTTNVAEVLRKTAAAVGLRVGDNGEIDDGSALRPLVGDVGDLADPAATTEALSDEEIENDGFAGLDVS
jgi:hypothetical protein